MDTDDLRLKLTALVERSEERIDKTNEMIAALVDITNRNQEMYDKHLTSLEESRNAAQNNAMKSIETSRNLTVMMENLREDYRTHLDSLRDELHRLRGEYRSEMQEMRHDYQELSASYRRLAERVAGSPKAEVKITQ